MICLLVLSMVIASGQVAGQCIQNCHKSVWDCYLHCIEKHAPKAFECWGSCPHPTTEEAKAAHNECMESCNTKFPLELKIAEACKPGCGEIFGSCAKICKAREVLAKRK